MLLTIGLLLSTVAAAPTPPVADPLLIYKMLVGLVVSLIGTVIGLLKYISMMKLEPIDRRLATTEKAVANIETQLLQQVREIAETNFAHRLSQQEDMSALKILLLEKHPSKEGCKVRMDALREQLSIELKAALSSSNATLSEISKKLDDLA